MTRTNLLRVLSAHNIGISIFDVVQADGQGVSLRRERQQRALLQLVGENVSVALSARTDLSRQHTAQRTEKRTKNTGAQNAQLVQSHSQRPLGPPGNVIYRKACGGIAQSNGQRHFAGTLNHRTSPKTHPTYKHNWRNRHKQTTEMRERREL